MDLIPGVMDLAELQGGAQVLIEKPRQRAPPRPGKCGGNDKTGSTFGSQTDLGSHLFTSGVVLGKLLNLSDTAPSSLWKAGVRLHWQ